MRSIRTADGPLKWIWTRTWTDADRVHAKQLARGTFLFDPNAATERFTIHPRVQRDDWALAS